MSFGKFCMVRDLKSKPSPITCATVVDRFPNRDRAKRIRLQTGEHAGETRIPAEYELLEFVKQGEAPAILAFVGSDRPMPTFVGDTFGQAWELFKTDEAQHRSAAANAWHSGAGLMAGLLQSNVQQRQFKTQMAAEEKARQDAADYNRAMLT